jgi:hypothetical protein
MAILNNKIKFMNTTTIATFGTGVSFTGIGLLLRRQGKSWKAFFFGGIGMLIMGVVSLFPDLLPK